MTESNNALSPLLDRLGGESGLRTLLGAFYFRVLGNAELEPFFRETPIDRLLTHQREFLSAALENATPAMAERLTQAHGDLVARRGLDHRHFNAMLEALITAMSDLGYQEAVTQELCQRLETFRPAVLARPVDEG